ncbi:unnamed protein product [Paramecium primaurelia]|uniref:Myb-like domain-containing protein n=2 Tax=Paramecium primaurelia TaxID=5886 RepID=A0A8S1P9A1_PARPR|nr:unnamed protein product [Paramecium primaurelia]
MNRNQLLIYLFSLIIETVYYQYHPVQHCKIYLNFSPIYKYMNLLNDQISYQNLEQQTEYFKFLNSLKVEEQYFPQIHIYYQLMQREKRIPSRVWRYEEYSPPRRPSSSINRRQRKRELCYYKIQKISQNSQFTKEEDESILQYVKELGPKFVKIATFFPSKSYSMVKNRYYKHLRNKLFERRGSQELNPNNQDTTQQFKNSMIQPSNEKIEELNQLISSINLFPEITEITKSFIGELSKHLL